MLGFESSGRPCPFVQDSLSAGTEKGVASHKHLTDDPETVRNAAT